MRVGIASDHRGIDIKENLLEYLKNKDYEVVDYGSNLKESVDYPDYAFLLAKKVVSGEVDRGILICGTGIGMVIAANKVKGARCAKVDNLMEAELARTHNDANMISLSSYMNVSKMKEVLDVFLTTDFSNEERHLRRVKKIDDYND